MKKSKLYKLSFEGMIPVMVSVYAIYGENIISGSLKINKFQIVIMYKLF